MMRTRHLRVYTARLARWFRQMVCSHRFDFVARLPEINGRAAIRYRCAHCRAQTEFADARTVTQAKARCP